MTANQIITAHHNLTIRDILDFNDEWIIKIGGVIYRHYTLMAADAEKVGMHVFADSGAVYDQKMNSMLSKCKYLLIAKLKGLMNIIGLCSNS